MGPAALTTPLPVCQHTRIWREALRFLKAATRELEAYTDKTSPSVWAKEAVALSKTKKKGVAALGPSPSHSHGPTVKSADDRRSKVSPRGQRGVWGDDDSSVGTEGGARARGGRKTPEPKSEPVAERVSGRLKSTSTEHLMVVPCVG